MTDAGRVLSDKLQEKPCAAQSMLFTLVFSLASTRHRLHEVLPAAVLQHGQHLLEILAHLLLGPAPTSMLCYTASFALSRLCCLRFLTHACGWQACLAAMAWLQAAEWAKAFTRAYAPSRGRALASAGSVIYAGNHRGSLVQ
jgi:hypothetical protein